jgi:hypothetical protein
LRHGSPGWQRSGAVSALPNARISQKTGKKKPDYPEFTNVRNHKDPMAQQGRGQEKIKSGQGVTGPRSVITTMPDNIFTLKHAAER